MGFGSGFELGLLAKELIVKFFWSFMLVLFAASMVVLAMPERVAMAAEGEAADASSGETARSVNSVRSPRAEPTARVEAFQATEETPANPVSAGTDGADQAPVTMAAQAGQSSTQAAPAGEMADNTQAAEAEAAQAEPVAMDPFAQAARAYLGLDEPEGAPSSVESTTTIMDALTQGSTESTEPEAAQEVVVADAQPDPEPAAPASRVSVQADGSLVIDGRITVPGDGSVDRPFVIEWSLLTGVSREYKPESGLKEIPEWLGALEGKRVRLTGHIVLPLVAKASDELLLTMNPWDGCCVGVPPTPYDAMEVTLAEAKSFSGTSLYGGLEGTFRVEPYVVSGWLLGLYLLDDARLAG